VLKKDVAENQEAPFVDLGDAARWHCDDIGKYIA